LEDVERIWCAIASFDITHALNFKLNSIGVEKAKKFSQKNSLVKVALVLEDRILQTKTMNMFSTDMFSVDGFEKKQAKALRK
jgi:preprotein translocase subunit SecD